MVGIITAYRDNDYPGTLMAAIKVSVRFALILRFDILLSQKGRTRLLIFMTMISFQDPF